MCQISGTMNTVIFDGKEMAGRIENRLKSEVVRITRRSGTGAAISIDL